MGKCLKLNDVLIRITFCNSEWIVKIYTILETLNHGEQ